jgi:hypothetical protein
VEEKREKRERKETIKRRKEVLIYILAFNLKENEEKRKKNITSYNTT